MQRADRRGEKNGDKRDEQQEKFEKVYADDEVLTMESATEFLKSLGFTLETEGQGSHLTTLFLPNREVQFLIS